MELHQLRTFLAVAREGNLTRAARQLHASQPAVTAQIKALEEELALLLFQRTAGHAPDSNVGAGPRLGPGPNLAPGAPMSGRRPAP